MMAVDNDDDNDDTDLNSFQWPCSSHQNTGSSFFTCDVQALVHLDQGNGWVDDDDMTAKTRKCS